MQWLAYLSVLFLACEQCAGLPANETIDVEVASEQLDGNVLQQLGQLLNNTLLKIIGQTFYNYEQKVDMKLCEVDACSPWSKWSKCSAITDGTFGYQSRSRSCWQGNTQPCANDGEQVIENESKFCEGNFVCTDNMTVTTNGFCVLVSPSLMTRPEGELYCRKFGAHLMNIDTADRWTDVVTLADKHSITYLWIDGLRQSAGGPWAYNTGSDPATLGTDFWKSSEPSNGTTELCKVAQKDSSVFYWFDRNCDASYQALCEYRQ